MKKMFFVFILCMFARVSAEETKEDPVFSVSIISASSDVTAVSSQTAKKIEADISKAAEIRLYKKFVFSDDADSSDVLITVSEEHAFENTDMYIVSAVVQEKVSGKILFSTKTSPVNINGAEKASFELASALATYLESYRKIFLAERAKVKEEPKKKPEKESFSYSRLFPYGGLSFYKTFGSFAGTAKYASAIKTGFGIDDFKAADILDYALCLRGEIEYSSFSPAKSNVAGLKTFSLAFGGGKKFRIEIIDVIPCLMIGYQMGIMNFDSNGKDSQGRYDYSVKTYYDPLLKLNCEFVYEYGNLRFFASPSFNIFFEKENTGIYSGLSIGAGYMF